MPISFQVDGGAGWCNKGVTVRLKASSPDVLTDGSEPFQQMLGRIRAIIEGDCSKVRNIGFYGRTKSDEVSVGESSKLTDWVYVPFKLHGKPADCKGPSNSSLCAQRWRVFNDVRGLFLKGAFSEAVLTRYLSTDEGADAEFVSGDARGRVAFVPLTSGVPFTDAAAFARQQIEQQSQRCKGEYVKGELASLSNGAASQGGTCRTTDRKTHSHFVISKAPDGFEVIAFSDFTEKGMSGRRLAAELNAVLSGTELPWSDIKHENPNDGKPGFAASGCPAVAQEFAELGSRPVAIRLVSERTDEPGLWALRTATNARGETSKDAWKMRIRNISDAEQATLQQGEKFGYWLLYRITENGQGIQFENQLYVGQANTECTPFRTPKVVRADSLPNHVNELYVDNLDLLPADSSPEGKRATLQQWMTDRSRAEAEQNAALQNDMAKLQQMAEAYPVPLLVALSDFNTACFALDSSYSVVFADDFVTRTDIDGDGDLDYIATGDGAICKDAGGVAHLRASDNGALRVFILTNTTSGPVLALDAKVQAGTVRRHKGFAVLDGGNGTIYQIADGQSRRLDTSPEGGEIVYSLVRPATIGKW
ncbi:hypothetical protein [Ensifer adhaerens]|uniref:hypothetical protein n=1 Tax=Ensifer adhaerens TaxID=106592 RepID=UPI000CF0D5E7|nr:hypothetical protein [Ensifer adhaerens]